MKKLVKVFLSTALACAFGVSLISCQINPGNGGPLNLNFNYSEKDSESGTDMMLSQVYYSTNLGFSSTQMKFYLHLDEDFNSSGESDFVFGIKSDTTVSFNFSARNASNLKDETVVEMDGSTTVNYVPDFKGKYELSKNAAGEDEIHFVVTDYYYVSDSSNTYGKGVWKSITPEIDWKTVNVSMKDNHPNSFNIVIEENDPVGKYLNNNYGR